MATNIVLAKHLLRDFEISNDVELLEVSHKEGTNVIVVNPVKNQVGQSEEQVTDWATLLFDFFRQNWIGNDLPVAVSVGTVSAKGPEDATWDIVRENIIYNIRIQIFN